MRTPNIALAVCNVLLVALVFHLAPLMRKRSLFFGVTVDEGFRNSGEAHGIARTFRILVWTGAALAIAALSLAGHMMSPGFISLGALIEVAFGIAAWIYAWRCVRPHSGSHISSERVVTLGQKTPSLPGGILAILIPFAGPAAATWYLWSRYADLPARYPIHWNAAGQADRFASKSLLSVYFPPIMSTCVLLLLAVFALSIQYGSRRGISGEQPGWSAKHQRLNLLLLVAVMWILSVMLSIPSFGPLFSAEVVRLATWCSITALLVVIAVFCVRMYRISMQPTGGTDATPDECWRWGLVYYNPDDAALIVEKREGPGFTLNFGNTFSWVIVVLILLITILPVVVRKWL